MSENKGEGHQHHEAAFRFKYILIYVTGIRLYIHVSVIRTVFATAVSHVAGITPTAQGCTGSMVTLYAFSSKRREEGRIVLYH